MSAPPSSRATSVRSIPVGYAGFVPGLLSGNLHGAPWKDILNVVQNTPRNNQPTAKEIKLTKMLYGLKDDTLKSVCQDLGLESNGQKEVLTTRILHHATAEESRNVARPDSTTSDTSSQDTVVNAHRPSQIPSVAANPRSAADFVPRLGGPTASWAPPRQPLGLTPRPAGLTPRVYPVGYSGHVPGLIAGNLHGAPWRDLLTPRSDVASPRRLLATPRSATLRPPASAPAGGARTPRLTSSSRLSVDLYCG